ncbi:MAG: LD-carboxypeptidase [Treponema sp.]|nr:LD-carboxypeptidase [Treponema sp.]
MVKKVAIISLSRGILGEPFISHELKIGLDRLKSYGLEVVTTESALKGVEYIKNNPQARAKDLLDALYDKSVDMILCAIGGDDTYKLLPYLFENDELKKAVKDNKKIFLGYSDTTWNHFMFNKVGFKTFYGQAFITDLCELEDEMLPYSKKYFEELINKKCISKIEASDVWYTERTDFGISQIGKKREAHKNQGFQLLQGSAVFSGEILGGCIESMYDMFDGSRYPDTVELCKKYNLFPAAKEWQGKILLLESSEEKTKPELYRKMVKALKEAGVFNSVSGVLVGKPFDEIYYNEYKSILLEEIDDKNLPLVYNVNVGHATPHCIIPLGVKCTVDMNEKCILFDV